MPSTLRKKHHRKHRARMRHAAHARTKKPRRHYEDQPVVMPPRRPPKPPPKPRPGPKPPPLPDTNHRNAERLLWRAGFGPRLGDVERVVKAGLAPTVQAMVHPATAPKLVGPDPRDEDGNALSPFDAWGHDHLWWLDRMVRCDQPLVERMTLIWHDWFATSNDKVGDQRMMIEQNELLRSHALGNFKDMLLALTVDHAMLVWLDGIDNRASDVNENFAREVMELFTLGADRGAYTEDDVRELARAFTGWRSTWVDGVGQTNFRFDSRRHDSGQKTVFGKTGDFDWQDAVQLCVENPFHASFFVTKLWGYFVPTPPSEATQALLQKVYLDSGYEIAPVVEAILKHPDLYGKGAMVKPPIVYNAGLLRTTGRYVDTSAWAWLGELSGQQLFFPPNVSGWDDSGWLNTSTWRGRAMLVTYALRDRYVDPWEGPDYDATETAEAALKRALAFTGNPSLTTETRAALLHFSQTCMGGDLEEWQRSPYRAMRQNALRHLILTSSDWQAS